MPTSVPFSTDSNKVRPVSTTITIRGLTEAEKSWLRVEAKRTGVSMEEFVRRLIRRRRERSARSRSVGEMARRHFGPEHGVELPRRRRFGYRPLDFSDRSVPDRESV